MHKFILSLSMAAPLLSACGASVPPPTERMANAESAERSAKELGAVNVPAAALSLTLAHEQITAAKKAMNDGDNERASSLLLRARADAELAIAEARETGARTDTQTAVDASAAQKSTNADEGAAK